MFRTVYLWIRKHLLKIDDRSPLQMAIDSGLKIGKDCHVMEGCTLDPGHCWLIEIGDRVTLAPRVQVLAHDASTKRPLGYTRISRVSIGDDVFIGAGSIILPGVTIGSKVIIGAGSVVSKSIPEGSVAVGNPCAVIGSYDEFISRKSESLKSSPCYGEEYTFGVISEDMKARMNKDLASVKEGYIR